MTKNLEVANQWKYPKNYPTGVYPETTSIKCNVGGTYTMRMAGGTWGEPELWLEGAPYPIACTGIKNEAGTELTGTEFTLYYSEAQ